MRALFPLVILTLSAGCAPTIYEATGFPSAMHGPQPAAIPATAQVIRVSGTLFQRLTGQELRRAVVGHSIHFHQSIMTDSGMSHYGQRWFAGDGRTYYWSRFRQGHGRGAYSIRHDRICTTGNAEHCFTLYRSTDRRFLRHMPGRGAPALVTLRPIPSDWSPRLQQE